MATIRNRIKLVGLLLVGATALATVAVQGADTFSAQASGVLWSAGQEAGSLGEWTASSGGRVYSIGSGVESASTDVAHSGKYSAKLSISNATGGSDQDAQLYRWAETSGLTDGYYSTWYYFPQSYSGMNWWNVMQFESKTSSGSSPLWTVNVGNRNGSMYFYLWDCVNGKYIGQSVANLPVGRWSQLEVYYRSASDGNGQVTLWQDGTQILSVPSVNTRRSGDQLLWAVGNYTNLINPSNATIYVDDAAISTSRVGTSFTAGSSVAASPTPTIAPTTSGTTVTTQSKSTATPVTIATATPAPTSSSGSVKVSALVDNFNDNSTSASLWKVGSYSGGQSSAVSVSETNGTLQVTPATNSAGYNGYTSQASYDLTGSAIYLQVPQATGPNSSSETLFQLNMDGNNRLEMLASGSALKARVMVAGTMTTVAGSTYSPSQWWRIRHDSSTDTVYWESSSNGTSWTSVASRKRDFAITALKVSLQAGTWGADASPGKAIFDNVNTGGSTSSTGTTATPAPTVVSTPAPTATPAPSTGSMSAPAGYSNLAFDDKFTGSSLDSSKWIYEMADQYGVWRDNGKLPAPYSAVGNDGNYNAEYGDPAMVKTGSGLVLDAQRSSQFSGYSWKAGYATSHGKYYFTGGYIQVRAKMPDARTGNWAGIWFLEGGGEIDLIERGNTLSGVDTNRTMATNLHTSGNSQKTIDTGVDLSADYHVYGMEYVPGQRIVMYLDGREVARYTSNIPTGGYEIILTNTMAQNATGWHTVVSSSTPSSLPMYISEVQIWK